MAKLDDFDVFDDVTPARAGESEGERVVVNASAVITARIPMPRQADSDNPHLSRGERADLAACEAALDALRVAFWAAGKALQVIRDGRLHRETHGSFEAYVGEVWGMSRAQAYRLIEAWPVAEALSGVAEKLNEGQVRELLPVAERHGADAAVIVYEAVATAPETKVTASVLHGAVQVLPPGPFNRDEAIRQIRAYLAGELTPAAKARQSTSPVEALQSEVTRLRTILGRGQVNAMREAFAARPDEAKQLIADLQAVLDELAALGIEA